MHNTPSSFKTVRTLITEFKFHVGSYWRTVTDNDTVVIVKKAFDENRATVFINKSFFDALLKKAYRIQSARKNQKRPTHMKKVLRGPKQTIQSVTQIIDE